MSKRNNKIIHRYIQTHPDMDHMRGLSRLSGEFEVLNFWDTRNIKTISSFNSDNDRLDWLAYTYFPEDKKRYYEQGHSCLYLNQDNIEILSPTCFVTNNANYQQNHNNHSYILRITHGKASIVGKKPETDAHVKYSNYSKVYSTRHHGNIILEVDSFVGCKWHFEKNDPDYLEKYLSLARYKKLLSEQFQKDLV